MDDRTFTQITQMIQQVADEKKDLFSNRDLVLEKINTIGKTEKVNDVVLEWLNDANKLIKEIEMWDHSKMILEKYNKIKTLNDKCKFKSFSSPIPGLEYFSCANFVCLDSTKMASDQLLEALNDNRSHIIGLYGSSGSGKTTLVKAVGEKAEYLKIFDTVLFITVSQNSIIKIRDQLAESLNMRLDKNTEFGRAKQIYSTLESMNSILVILDDVSTKFELEDICIPCNGSRCKVLLTTRHQQVCTSMNCQREIPLLPLSQEEVWTLLKKYSGIDDESSPNLIEVAQKVALECKGLPNTIKDVGSSLKSKAIKEWEASLHCLRHPMARYQVFLSFRGKDTRHSFTGFLYHTLCREGFKTFIDKDGMEGGSQISQYLIEAINASRLSIVVLSRHYAYSSWCLDELVTVLECMKKKHQEVLPIFYKVQPTNVRHQKNFYGEAMATHENTLGKDSEKVKRWRSALFEVANLSGMHYSTGYEYEFIQMIMEKVNSMKNRLYIQSMDTD